MGGGRQTDVSVVFLMVDLLTKDSTEPAANRVVVTET